MIHNRSKLEKNRPLFFLTGLIIALLFAIGSLQYSIGVLPTKLLAPDTLAMADDPEPIVTIRQKPDKPKEEHFNKQLPPEVRPEPFPEPEPDPVPDPPLPVHPADTSLGDVDMPDDWDDEPAPMHMSVVQHKPVFQGCEHLSDEEERYRCLEKGLQRFLAENTDYPEQLRRMGVQGRAFVEFTIDRNGRVIEVQAVGNRADRRLEREAVKAVEQLPDFVPGKHNGLPVHVQFVVPVNFRLQ